ncbi:uncharacterized protein LOC129050933 isoform X2 [Pongo abelii]|uniref:uncharacterized protein LOC129050933 isoform X2 n=1 Tax=Pongo abelii TaxID=9601 RepID=UPI0023E8F2A6|nr:uncharacterized protein LOC129050933 isoform X4 [Pongo abelii]
MACRHFFPLKDGGIERQLPWLWNVSLGNRCETDKVCRTSRLSITPAPAPALLTPAWVPQPLHLWILSGYKVLAAFLQERMDHLPTKPPALEPSSQIPLSVEAKSDAQRTHQTWLQIGTSVSPAPPSSCSAMQPQQKTYVEDANTKMATKLLKWCRVLWPWSRFPAPDSSLTWEIDTLLLSVFIPEGGTLCSSGTAVVFAAQHPLLPFLERASDFPLESYLASELPAWASALGLANQSIYATLSHSEWFMEGHVA